MEGCGAVRMLEAACGVKACSVAEPWEMRGCLMERLRLATWVAEA